MAFLALAVAENVKIGLNKLFDDVSKTVYGQRKEAYNNFRSLGKCTEVKKRLVFGKLSNGNDIVGLEL